MRVLWNEIKKIWNWKILLLLCIANVLMCLLFIENPATAITRGRPALDEYRIAAEMARQYGSDMEEEDFAHFKKAYEAQIGEAGNYLRARPEFAAAGIRSYEDFMHFDSDDSEQNALRNKVLFKEKVDLFWELQARRILIEEWHDNRAQWMERAWENAGDAKQKARLGELRAAGHVQTYPGIVLQNYKDFISSVAVAVIVSVVMALSPVFIKDRLGRMLDLQYTTRQGRNLYKTKAAAGLVSACIAIASLLIVYLGLYAFIINHKVLRHDNLSVFFQVPLHTFTGSYYWYDPTFLQYVILTIAAVVVLGLAFALLAMCFSGLMSNYVALIGVQIPFVFGALFFGLYYCLDHIIDIRMAKWMAPVLYSLAAVSGAAFMLLLWRREKRRDIA
ncbi:MULTISPECIES: hypothetical protein [unclassified Paenibacillus]|uniref:hypothetical protein n=1 Tax=unclassified Paenibacillus TaxID=185978 RepID=UPI001C108AB7|nr:MULTISPECIES: hypothetical protein [unclassified Paenibacillus]MBU5444059.1 hypothetical protein [Paenibacillus sp. MSJ-34]CAH0118665.1 hypothetical protein PAE9249_01157 [Paenibacillus sp. CECT 9249]